MSITIWDCLGIEKTFDLSKIKKAYKKTLKRLQGDNKHKELADLNEKYTEIVNEIKIHLQDDKKIINNSTKGAANTSLFQQEPNMENIFIGDEVRSEHDKHNVVDVYPDDRENEFVDENGLPVDNLNNEDIALEDVVTILNDPALRNNVDVWEEFFLDNLTSYNLNYLRRHILEAFILYESNDEDSFIFIKNPWVYNILDKYFELEYAQVYKELAEFFEEEKVDNFYSAIDLAKSLKERSLIVDFKVPAEMEEDYVVLMNNICAFEYEGKEITENTFKEEIKSFHNKHKKERLYKKYLAYNFYNIYLLGSWPSRKSWGQKGIIYKQIKKHIGMSYKASAKYLPKPEKKILKEVERAEIMPYLYAFLFFKAIVLLGKYVS